MYQKSGYDTVNGNVSRRVRKVSGDGFVIHVAICHEFGMFNADITVVINQIINLLTKYNIIVAWGQYRKILQVSCWFFLILRTYRLIFAKHNLHTLTAFPRHFAPNYTAPYALKEACIKTAEKAVKLRSYKTRRQPLNRILFQSTNQSLFSVRLKVDQRVGKFSLPHVGITITERNKTKA